MNSGAHRQFAVWGNRVRAAARGDLRARPPGSVCTTALRCGAADDPIRERPPAALTGFARSEDRVRAVQSGVEVHLSKPIEPMELMATAASLTREGQISTINLTIKDSGPASTLTKP